MYSGALRGGRWRRDKEEEGLGAGAEAGEGWFPKEEKPTGRAERGEELQAFQPSMEQRWKDAISIFLKKSSRLC